MQQIIAQHVSHYEIAQQATYLDAYPCGWSSCQIGACCCFENAETNWDWRILVEYGWSGPVVAAAVVVVVAVAAVVVVDKGRVGEQQKWPPRGKILWDSCCCNSKSLTDPLCRKCPIFKRAAITGNQNAFSKLKVQLGTKTVTISYLVLLELLNRQTPGAYIMKLYSAVI